MSFGVLVCYQNNTAVRSAHAIALTNKAGKKVVISVRESVIPN